MGLVVQKYAVADRVFAAKARDDRSEAEKALRLK